MSTIGQSSRLIVLGMMGRMPLAGVIWQVLHYLEGFRRLGFDVYYVEDTGAWPYNPDLNTVTEDPGYAVDVIGRVMAAHGFADRWAYLECSHRNTFGLTAYQLGQIFETADLLVNLTASTVLRAEHLRVPVRVYLETDPVLPQIEVATGKASTINLLGAHTHHFSYGENLGMSDCGVPVERFHYVPTRQPVVLDWWTPFEQAHDAAKAPLPSGPFTTIANWRQAGKDLDWNGERYTWSKHHEFLKFIDLPKRTPQPLELALALMGGPNKKESAAEEDPAEVVGLLTSRGWRVVDAMDFSKNPSLYRDYILASRGEFTVAKDQNVRLRSGWFSDRSACYLAAGRPVITQDTGFGKVLPTGEGLFSFRTMDDILTALAAIDSDYPRHSNAARDVADECFKAETVLAKLIHDIGL